MIGYDVENEAHSFFLQRIDKLIEFFQRTQFGIELGGIDYIVAMRAAGPRLQNRRSVKIRDTEIVQVIDDFNRIRKSEITIELKPVGRDWNPHDTFRKPDNAGVSAFTDRFWPSATKWSTHSRAIESPARAFSS